MLDSALGWAMTLRLLERLCKASDASLQQIQSLTGAFVWMGRRDSRTKKGKVMLDDCPVVCSVDEQPSSCIADLSFCELTQIFKGSWGKVSGQGLGRLLCNTYLVSAFAETTALFVSFQRW